MGSSRNLWLVAAIVVLLIAVSTALVALGPLEAREITGVVRRVGSEPLTNLVVTQDDIDYIVPETEKHVFEGYIGKTVRVTATVRTEEMQTVDGSFTVVRHYLVDPVVVGEEQE